MAKKYVWGIFSRQKSQHLLKTLVKLKTLISGSWAGVELFYPDGKNDGSVEGKEYKIRY